MGLHRENNAVMQIRFLPGQVRTWIGEGQSSSLLVLPLSPSEGVVRGPGFGAHRKTSLSHSLP
jgi:hypothetical protein